MGINALMLELKKKTLLLILLSNFKDKIFNKN
jgi:hypothetical protein